MIIFLFLVAVNLLILASQKIVDEENNAFENNFEGKNYQVELQNSDQLFGFGFWSQCVPQLQNSIRQQYDVERITKTRQLLFISFNQFISLIALVEFNNTNNFIKHKFYLTENDQISELTFIFNPQEYEGKWLFNLVVFDQKENQIQLQITEQEGKQFNLYSKFSFLNITLGGFEIQEKNYILDYFKGRFSFLEINYDVQVFNQNLLQQFASSNKQPNKNFQTQFQYIIKEVFIKSLSTNQIESTIISQQGNWYAISGWIKLELKLYIQLANVDAIRISSKQLNFKNESNFIFGLNYEINKIKKNLSSVSISAEFHSFPLITNSRLYQKMFTKILQQEKTQMVYQAIQEVIQNKSQWHFFQYQYSGELGRTIKISFQNELGIYSENLGDDKFQQSYINSKFYIYIGENLESNQEFYGSFSQIQFFHNDGISYFQNLNNGCHFSCKTCFGPHKNNCLSCENSTNRILIEERKECSCKLGFMVSNNLECLPYNNIYPNKFEEEKLQQDNLCSLGQFMKPTSNNQHMCLEWQNFIQISPKNNKNEFYCLECILNSKSWYQYPYCQTYIHSRQLYNDDAYVIYYEKEQINFIIDEENQFIILPLFDNFCDQCSYLNSLNLSGSMKKFIDKFIIFEQFSYSKCFNSTATQLHCHNCSPEYYYDEIAGCQECPKDNETLFIAQLTWNQCAKNKTQKEPSNIKNCGSYCLLCNYQNLCYKCVDDQYYISLDGRNCRKNEIPHCLEAFQALKNNYTQNSLGFFLWREYQVFDQKYAVILCARCEDNYVFVFSIKQCLKLVDYNCLFAVAEELNQNSGNQSQQAIYSNDDVVTVNQYHCLITNEYSENSVQYFYNCYQKIANCVSCLRGNYLSWICTECNFGYVLNDQFNCEQNWSSPNFDELFLDYPIRFGAFIQYLGIFENQIHHINQNQTIRDCHQSCLECTYNLTCLRCKTSNKGRLLSLSQSQQQCIECPQYCNLCVERTIEQIHQINPLFINQEFQQYTSKCLAQNNNQNLFYDKELGQFIKCLKGQPCKKELTIKLNLYCAQDEYLKDLYQNNNTQQIKFAQENILYEDLMVNSFPQFYNKEFYDKANTENIRKVSFLISTQKAQTCQSDQIHPIVNFEFSFQFEVSFLLPENLIFENFTSIVIQNITFINISKGKTLSIFFSSNYFIQSIIISNVRFQGNKVQTNSAIFQFINVEILQVFQFNLSSMSLLNGQIFNVKPIKSSQILNFTYMSFSDIEFSNFSIIEFNLHNNVSITLENIDICNCSLLNSFLIYQQNQNFSTESIVIKKLKILNASVQFSQNKNRENRLINLENFKIVKIEQIIISSSELINVILFNLNQNSEMQKCLFEQNILKKSILVVNDFSKTFVINYNFENLIFTNNTYNHISHFIKLQGWKSSHSYLKINFLTMSENQIFQTSNDVNGSLHQSLIYISLNQVLLQNLFIQNEKGIQLISFGEIFNLTIQYIQISQQEIIKQLWLHQKASCYKQNQFNSQKILNFYSIDFLLIQDMNITNNQFLSSIVFYTAKNIEVTEQKEFISLKRIYAHQNTILLGGIISILSFQQSKINILDSIFSTNLMQEYEGNWENQAIIINIQAKYSSVSIQNTIFEKNIILNSYKSITYIQSQNISVKNSSYFQNNLIQYQLLQPFMFWDFEEGQNIFLEDILDNFQIKSLSGNGVFEFTNIIMENISIKESRAFQSAGFKLIPQSQSEIYFSEFQLQSIETTFSNVVSDCGVLIFDLSNCENLILRIQNVFADQIFLYNKCSLIKIYNSYKNVDVVLKNIYATDIFSQSAGLVNFTFHNPSYHQSITISKIHYETSEVGWENFTNNFLRQSLLQHETSEFQLDFYLNRTVFFSNFGTKILFEKITIYNLSQESVFILKNVQKLILSNIIVQNLVINDNLIFVTQLTNNTSQFCSESNILISNLKIRNVTQQIFKSICLDYNRKQYKIECNPKLAQAPQFLDKLRINLKDYCKSWIENSTFSNSIIQFIQYSNLSQLQIYNLELFSISCFRCFNGAIFIQFFDNDSSNSLKLQINNLYVLESQCGELSCIYISNSLQTKESQAKKNKITLQNYHCINNKGYNGTCLNVDNLKIVIRNSIFKNNKASQAGGALYFQNNDNFIFIENCYIADNYAIFGGGIFLLNQFNINYRILGTLLQNNQAFYKGQDIYSYPKKLSFQYGGYENNCQIDTIYQNVNQTLDQVVVQKSKKIFGIETDYLLIPNGQRINKYQYFDWQNRKYQHLNLTFRIIALTNLNEMYINLDNTSCVIRSGLVNYKIGNDFSIITYTNNYTNFNKVNFNLETEDYNLDNLEIYFPNNEDALSIEFQCDSISIPIENKNYPYNIISIHQNYTLRFFLKPLPCQLGEIKNTMTGTCNVCNFEDGFFSLELNSHNCQIKDDVSTIKVYSALLQLRPGFWRPYFDTSIISNCENQPLNCLGGWIEGDQSCFVGHIGASCEQCDLKDTRGDGKYYRTNTYNCSLCKDSAYNIYLLILLIIYIFVSILFSVSSNIDSVEQQLQILKMKLLGFRVFFLYNEKAILLKILTSYIQMIGTIYDIQKNIQLVNNNLINFSIYPIQSMTASVDCLVSNYFALSIHYVTIIFELIQPLCFTIMVFVFFNLKAICSILKLNRQVIVSTTLIYIYIYFQPILVGKLVQLVSYRRISEFSWILANVAYRYDINTHQFWMYHLFIPSLTILAFLIPSFFLYSLYTNKYQLNNKIVRQKWGYLFQEYRQEAYQWEILKILQKSILLGFLNYYENYSTIQVLIVILVLLVYHQFSIYFKPYSNQKLSILDQSLVKVCLISVSSILLIKDYLGISTFVNVQKYLLMSINFRYLCQISGYLILSFSKEILKKFEDKLDKIRDYIRNNCEFFQQIHSINKIIQNQAVKKKSRAHRLEKLKLYLIQKGKIQLEQQKGQIQSQKLTIQSSQLFKFSNQQKNQDKK